MNLLELPDTVNRLIIRYLDFEDRLSLGLTCRKFANDLGSSYDFMSSVNLTIRLEKYDFGYLSTHLKCFKNSKRIYPTVTIRDSGATFELLTNDRIKCLLDLFNSIGNQIRSLTISGYVIFPEDLVKMLNTMPNLEELDIFLVQARRLSNNQLIFCLKLKKLVIRFKNNYMMLAYNGEFLNMGTDDYFQIFSNLKNLNCLEILFDSVENPGNLDSLAKILWNQKNLKVLRLQNSQLIDLFLKPPKFRLKTFEMTIDEEFQEILDLLEDQKQLSSVRVNFESKDVYQPQLRIIDKVLELPQLASLEIESYLNTRNLEVIRTYPKIKDLALVFHDNNSDHRNEFTKFVLATPNLEALKLGGQALEDSKLLENLNLKRLNLVDGCSPAVMETLNFPALSNFTTKVSHELLKSPKSWENFFQAHEKLVELNFTGNSPPLSALQFAEFMLPRLNKIIVSKTQRGSLKSQAALDLFAFSRISEKFEATCGGKQLDLLDNDSSSVIVLKRKQKRKEVAGKVTRKTEWQKKKKEKQCVIS